MAYLAIGIILEVLFVLSIVGLLLTAPALSITIVASLFVVLAAPGIVLIWLGKRNITLFRKVGVMIIAQYRQTGHVDVGLIANETGYHTARINAVLAKLRQRGVIPPDVA